MTIKQDLLDQIETFLSRNGMKPTVFGRLCMNDTAFVVRLRAGADVRMETADRIRTFMETYKPPLAKRRRREDSGVAA